MGRPCAKKFRNFCIITLLTEPSMRPDHVNSDKHFNLCINFVLRQIKTWNVDLSLCFFNRCSFVFIYFHLTNFCLCCFHLSDWNEFICIWISEITPLKKVSKLDYQDQRKLWSFYLAWIWTPSPPTTTTMRLTNLKLRLAKQVSPPQSPGLHVTKTGNSSWSG